MPDPSDELLAETIDGVVKQLFMLIQLLSKVSAEAAERFRARFDDLTERVSKGRETLASLPENERLEWGLAYFESLSAELATAIREMHKESQKK